MPIDRQFRAVGAPVAKGQGYDIWRSHEPPTRLGIHGTKAAVDFDLCIGDGACIDVCPVDVFEWLQTPGHPASDRKAAPVRESDCVSCNACESECPVEAIVIADDL